MISDKELEKLKEGHKICVEHPGKFPCSYPGLFERLHSAEDALKFYGGYSQPDLGETAHAHFDKVKDD